jgi:hypothetical protein
MQSHPTLVMSLVGPTQRPSVAQRPIAGVPVVSPLKKELFLVRLFSVPPREKREDRRKAQRKNIRIHTQLNNVHTCHGLITVRVCAIVSQYLVSAL